ncbi:MAG TPA: hypothetical protein VG960_01520 [Caulobacteraceae bacterium]|nr:hypothetical protein [Caulobacteraceae bacterium]
MSALSDALGRLVAGYYNSNPINAITNPGGLGNDGHEVNFPAALVDYALVVQYLAAINGNDLVALSAALASKAGNNVFTGANDFTSSAMTVATQAMEDSSTKAVSTSLLHKLMPRGHIDGLTLSTAGGSTSITVAPGQCVDSLGNVMISQAAALTKTTNGWAPGPGNGGLDQGALANSTWYHFYKIRRPDTGVDDVIFSQAPDVAGAATMTIATPCIVTKIMHGLEPGAPVVFTTTGALPTGLTAGVVYYVKTVPTVDTYQLAATQGGAAINTSGTQSGTHTATSTPLLPANYTQRRLIMSWRTDGAGKWVKGVQRGDDFVYDASPADLSNITLPTSNRSPYTVSVPPGVAVMGKFRVSSLNTVASAANFAVTSLDESDQAVGTGFADGVLRNGSGAGGQAVNVQVRTTPSAQIGVRGDVGSTSIWVNTYGFIHPRGRNN